MAQLSNGRGDCPGTIGACNDAVEPGTKRKCADFAARILRGSIDTNRGKWLTSKHLVFPQPAEAEVRPQPW